MQGLKDKVILVAGAATGIGAASARQLASEGARVVVGDLNLAGAEETAAAITGLGGQAVAARFDISDDASVRDLVATAVRAYGGLDAAHVNAGAMTMVPRDTDVVDIDLEVWDRTIAVNLRGHQGRHQRPGPARRRPVGQGRHPRQRHRAGPDPDPGDPGRRPAGHARQDARPDPQHPSRRGGRRGRPGRLPHVRRRILDQRAGHQRRRRHHHAVRRPFPPAGNPRYVTIDTLWAVTRPRLPRARPGYPGVTSGESRGRPGPCTRPARWRSS